MRKLALTALAAVLLAAPASAASWSRSGETTGPNGRTITTHVNGSCAGGSCERDAVKTGPEGKSWTSETDAQRTAPGTIDYTTTKTGPNGREVTRSGTRTINR